MNNATFTAFDSGVLVTKPISAVLLAEVEKVRALFGDVDFYWLWTATNCNSDEALYFYIDDERDYTLAVYANGSKPHFG